MSQPGMVGRVLGNRYRLDALLGQGGMSSVYRATDPNLRRTVAVKLIHPHLTSDPEFLRRFETEAASVAQLRHPNIIQVYDFERDGDTYYMVLEFVPGESLDRRLRRLATERHRLGPDEAATITADIAEAVDYAHGQGLIHRDIKPANIMLTDRGQAVLMDFGVAKIVGGTQHTATGMLVGTAFYISPEQVRGEPPSARSDIYALGVSLFEMLAGRPPFTGDSAMSVMLKHISEPIPDLRQIAPETPPYIIAVVEKAMAKDPRERYASAREMATALRQTGTISAGGPATLLERAPLGSEVSATLVDSDAAAGLAAPPSAPPHAAAPSPARSAAPSAPRPAATPGPVQRSSPAMAAPAMAPPSRAAAPAAAPSKAAPPTPAPSVAARSMAAPPMAAPPMAAPPSAAASGVGPVPAKRGGRACIWVAVAIVVVLLGVFLFFGAGTLFFMMGFLAPTATPLPTKTQTPTPTPAATVLYQDDFSNPSSGWTIFSNNNAVSKYDNGALVIQIVANGATIWSHSASGELSNVHVEVTAGSTRPPVAEGFGVMCNYIDDNNFYYLGISRSGSYIIAKMANGTATALTDANNSWVHSMQIAQNAASYRVGADCGSDGTLTLYADGQQVATVNDTTYKSGSLGLFVSSPVPAEIRFTDFLATALP